MNKKCKVLIALSAITIPLMTSFIINNNKSNISENIIKEVEKPIEETIPENSLGNEFSFEINSRPIFKDGKSEGSLMINNPISNDCLLKVEIRLEDSGEIVYGSDIIFPGTKIKKAKLFKELKAGEHNALAFISVYEPYFGKVMGMSAAKLVIKIEN